MKKIILLSLLPLFLFNLNASSSQHTLNEPLTLDAYQGSPSSISPQNSPTPLLRKATSVSEITVDIHHQNQASLPAADVHDTSDDNANCVSKYFFAMDELWKFVTGPCEFIATLARFSSVFASTFSLINSYVPDQFVGAPSFALALSIGAPVIQAFASYGNTQIDKQKEEYHINSTELTEDLNVKEKELFKSTANTKAGKWFKGIFDAYRLSSGVLSLLNNIIYISTPIFNFVSESTLISDDKKIIFKILSYSSAIGSIFLENFISNIPNAQDRQVVRLKIEKATREFKLRSAHAIID